ncbi:MAG TPA: tetratricopeptide repeat protein [Candidatus Binatia bacterium]|nr:tetratricopeptide repeat protein [Candidatus Binatia bacterium]
MSHTAQPAPRSLLWLRWVAPAIPIAAAFLLALTRMEDSDAFTHLALGRDLVQHRGFPAHEPFSFASPDRPYYNAEWLFDVALHLAWLAGGVAGVIVLKAAIVALAVWILWLGSCPEKDTAAGRPAGLLIRAAVLTVVVVMLRHRFVERPDIALMVFLAFTIYALDAYLAAGRRWIFALPLVALVWANTHPSIVVGLLPFAAVLGGGVALRIGLGLVSRWWRPLDVVVPTWRQLATVAAVLVGVVLASAVNPHRWDPLTLPFTLADQPWFRQEILELQPPRPRTWPGPYVLTALLLLSLVRTAARLPVIPALLVLPFVRLGLSAVRFVFLLELVAAPILARQLAALAGGARTVLAHRLVLGGAVTAVAAAVAVVGLALGDVGPVADPRKVMGLGLDERWVPERALRYLDARGIDGRLFNAFHFGGYIEWRDFPRRVPIVDGRGHATPSLLEEIHFARAYPAHLERLRARYGIEAAVLDYPTYSGDPVDEVLGPDADRALVSPDWALVYWDDVALVYLRRRGPHAAVVARDEYRWVKPANGQAGIARLLADPARAEAARAELTRNVRDTGSSLGLLLLGYATADLEQALATFARVRDPARRFEAYQAAALACWQRKDLARATAFYERALELEAAPPVLYNVGLVRVEAGDDKGAVAYLARARRLDPSLTAVYPALVDAYRRLGDEASARDLGPAFLAAAVRTRVAQQVGEARRLLAEGRTADADARLAEALKLDPKSGSALATLGYVRIAERRFDEAERLEEAALAADPREARAHWALAQLARARGDEPAARRHFQAFVRLAPRSYDAWRVREELAGRKD